MNRFRVVNNFKGEILSLMREANQDKLSHAEVLRKYVLRVIDKPDFKKLPQYVQSEIRGYFGGACEIHTQNNVQWRVGYNGDYILGELVPKGQWDKVTQGKMFYKGTDVVWFESDK